MSRWILLAALLAAPATAQQHDSQQINAVSQAWDRYATASSQDRVEAADLLARSSLDHYQFLRDVALHASADQLRRLPSVDRLLVYALRATQDAAALGRLDGTGVARLCSGEGWCGVAAADEGEDLAALSHVTLIGPDHAVSEIAPPTGTQYQFGPELVREAGQWKVVAQSTTLDDSSVVARQARHSGTDEDQFMELLLSYLLGEDRPTPALFDLERPLQDDAAARSLLNERWPDYEQPYGNRIRALEVKADDGETFARYVLGSLLVSGSMAKHLPQDRERGLALLEQASSGGDARAAWIVFLDLMDESKLYSPARLERAAIHLQRAAVAANPIAMSSLGSFYFEGVGGLARDCRQAAEWHARAEEAGLKEARNELVWTWATCPIQDQRNAARALQLVAYMARNSDTLSFGELDTVAAAYAANQRFEDAVVFQQRALDLLAKGEADVDDKGRRSIQSSRKRMQARLVGYRNNQDYVQDYDMYAEMAQGTY